MESKLRDALEFIRELPLSLFGLGLFYTWFSMLVNDRLAVGGVIDVNATNWFDLGICLLYVGMIASRKATISPRFLVSGSRAAVLSCMLGTAVHLCAVSGVLDAATDVIALVACGAGFAMATLVIKSAYCPFGPAQVAFLFCGSKLTSDALVFAFAGYNRPYYIGALIATLAAACFALAHVARRRSVEPSVKSEAQTRFPHIWKLLLLCFVFGVAYGYGSSGMNGEGGDVLAIDAAFCLLIITALLFAERLDFVAVYRLALPALVAAFLVIPAIPNVPDSISHAVIRISYAGVLAYTTILVCNLCRKRDLNPFIVFSMTGLAVHVSIRAGSFFAHAIPQASKGIAEIGNEGFMAIMITCAAIVTAIMASEGSLTSSWGLESGEAPGSISSSQMKRCLERWRKSYGLTAREEELLGALVQGESVDAIASDLYIATGTVKAHVQHIYRKVGVHSREELSSAFLEDAKKALGRRP